MSLQHTAQPRSSANGFGRSRIDRDSVFKAENKFQTGKTSGKSSSVGKEGVLGRLSRDWLFYLTTCLIGHNVEVQVLDGSVYSGIFHATNAEDFGVILKMARLIKGSSRGVRSNSDFINKPPSKTLIIPSGELVQVVAKNQIDPYLTLQVSRYRVIDANRGSLHTHYYTKLAFCIMDQGLPLTHDGLMPELLAENKQDLMTDSSISQSRHVEMQRELERWVPDDDVPECPELEHIFDGSWNRGWDQFEVNETLFGVKSTFNEELYTTRLEKGPQMRELENEASRIAREIEGEDTGDLHLAEERGIQLHGSLEVDEETRYSSVVRKAADDSGYDDTEDILLDYHNDETFGGVSSSIGQNIVTELSSGKAAHNDQFGGRTISVLQEGFPMSQSSKRQEIYQTGSDDPVGQLSIDHHPKNTSTHNASRVHRNQYSENVVGNYAKADEQKKNIAELGAISKPDDACSSLKPKEEDYGKARLSADATSYAPPHVSMKAQDKRSAPSEQPEVGVSLKTQGTAESSDSLARHSSSASSNSNVGIAASTGPRISPSSSMGSLSSEKSNLNPYAKEFRLNPKAKSFSPSQTPMRPASPVSDGSFYYPANMAAVPHMHGMPVGVGLGPTYPAHQPVIFNPQGTPTTQAYFPPGGPQMMLSHPRQLVYMPTYPTDMQYKGREY